MPRWTRRGDASSLREWYSLREAERWHKREGLAAHRNKKRRKAEHAALVSAARDGRLACLLRQRPIEDNPHSRGGRRWFSWDRGYLQHCGAECVLVVVLPFVPPHTQDDAVRERIPEVEHCFRNSRASLNGTTYTLLSRDCHDGPASWWGRAGPRCAGAPLLRTGHTPEVEAGPAAGAARRSASNGDIHPAPRCAG